MSAPEHKPRIRTKAERSPMDDSALPRPVAQMVMKESRVE